MRHTRRPRRCQAKTGTLNGVSNLAGYCDAAGGHTIAFALMMDGISDAAAHRLQDSMAITDLALRRRHRPDRSRAGAGGAARRGGRPALGAGLIRGGALRGSYSRAHTPSSARRPASSSTGTPSRSARSSFDPGLSPATT